MKGRFFALVMQVLLITGVFAAGVEVKPGIGFASPQQTLPSNEAALSKTGQAERLLALEQASESLYQAMQNGNAEQARLQVEQITSLIGAISYQGLTGVEGIHELTACVMDARTAVMKADPSIEAWKTTSARLRLAVNSLIHAKGALWLQYYKVLQEDTEKLGQAAIDNNSQAVQRSFMDLKNHYEIIRPAAVIHKQPSEIAALDSWMSYIGNLSTGGKQDLQSLQGALPAGQQLFQALFGKPKDEPVLLPIAGYSNPWHWSFLIGLWILLALGYTAYRKYAAEQEVRPAGVYGEKSSGKRTW